MTLSERIGELVGRDRPGLGLIEAFARYAAEQSSDARLSILCGLLAGNIDDDGAVTLAARAIRIHGGWSPGARQWLDGLPKKTTDERAADVDRLVIAHSRLRAQK